MILYFRDQDIRADALKEGREEGRQEGRKEGRQEGRQEESRRIAKNMLSGGMSRDMILEMTGLSEAELDAIQGELNATPTKE